MKCYDVAKMVIDEADEQFGSLWQINEEYLNIFEQYCGALDTLAKKHDGEAFEIEIDEMKMTISVSMECPDFVIRDKKDLYYELVKRSVSFGFESSEEGNLLVKLVFPSIWEKA